MINKLGIVFYAHRMYIVAILMLGLGLTGCTAPYGVTRVSPQDSYNLSVENALGTNKISVTTKDVLPIKALISKGWNRSSSSAPNIPARTTLLSLRKFAGFCYNMSA